MPRVDAVSLPPPPWEGLRARLLERADQFVASGDAAGGQALRRIVEDWWTEQHDWNARVLRTLSVHHEINNALVGVSGNVQLLQLGPVGRDPAVRDRLEVVIRESQRIRDAVLHLAGISAALRGQPPAASPSAEGRAA
jgi:signal transduction histidine kinase